MTSKKYNKQMYYSYQNKVKLKYLDIKIHKHIIKAKQLQKKKMINHNSITFNNNR